MAGGWSLSSLKVLEETNTYVLFIFIVHRGKKFDVGLTHLCPSKHVLRQSRYCSRKSFVIQRFLAKKGLKTFPFTWRTPLMPYSIFLKASIFYSFNLVNWLDSVYIVSAILQPYNGGLFIWSLGLSYVRLKIISAFLFLEKLFVKEL